ncbi:ISAs1 family transposase [Moritella marina]|uniref:ISAs1 family transposase n=1 Tax=Moritella marina TaxID=90736 RepID=UPI003703FB8F
MLQIKSIRSGKNIRKYNEITAIPELLKLLNIRGCLVTIDAICCQKKIASKILLKDENYVLAVAVKANQGRLEKAFIGYFHFDLTKSPDADSYST